MLEGESMNLAYHVTARENIGSICRHGLLPDIGGRSAELGENEPRIYLFPSLQECNDALLNWLGDCYEDIPENGLAFLAINIEGLEIESVAGYELTCTSPIPPDRIVEMVDEYGVSISKPSNRAGLSL